MRRYGKQDKRRVKKKNSSSSCACKDAKKKKRKTGKHLKIHGTAREPVLGPNPYLNYFRQFYAKRGGKVIEVAKQAGANWRQMSSEEKDKYRGETKKKSPRIYYSRIRKLNRIFRLLVPKNRSKPIPNKKIIQVRKILEKWTRKVYLEVSGNTAASKGVATEACNKRFMGKRSVKHVRFHTNGKNGNGRKWED